MILVQNYSGLGNLLKNIVSALYIGEKSGVYVSTHINYADFFYFFNAHQVIRLPVRIHNTWSLEEFEVEFVNAHRVGKALYIVHDKNITFKAVNGLDFQYDNLTENVQNFIGNYWKRIVFSQDFSDYADNFLRCCDVNELVGVHVRSWSDDDDRKELLFDLGYYIEAMEEVDRGAGFYVSSDSLAVVEALSSVFPGRVFYQDLNIEERHIAYSHGKATFTAALRDLLLLSRCRFLIGSYQSTFSEASWWLSGCKQKVVIPVPDYVRRLSL